MAGAAKYKSKHGVSFHLHDGRRIAETIVDLLLGNDAVVERLGEYLPPLEQIRDEYDARNLVPDPGNGYLARPAVEKAVADALAASS